MELRDAGGWKRPPRGGERTGGSGGRGAAAMGVKLEVLRVGPAAALGVGSGTTGFRPALPVPGGPRRPGPCLPPGLSDTSEARAAKAGPMLLPGLSPGVRAGAASPWSAVGGFAVP